MKNSKDKEAYYRIQTANPNFGRCLFPFSECLKKPIKSHSIQNARVFDLLQYKSHVIQINKRLDPSGKPVLDFFPIGRNMASTFFGLCKKHDDSLFKAIDSTLFDPSNAEHLFLLAYRSMLKEFHASIFAFIKVQAVYSLRLKPSLIPGEDWEKDAIVVQRMENAYDTHLYKAKFDQALRNRDFDFLKHKIIVLDNQKPSIACSQLFSADSVAFEEDVLRVFLNILPVSNSKTLVVFSATREEFGLAESYFMRCTGDDENYSKYEISKMVIRNCENFFINPLFYSTWSKVKKIAIIDYYTKSMLVDEDGNSVDYYLFDT